MTHVASKPNRLIHEKSPYLLQHAYNPVDWYPWSEAALSRAKDTDRPILLSIGYSTCHWCHVMERESFSDPEIARKMNEHFICIKLDREERPDLDQIYVTAVSAMRGSAGWPLNVFLTPELKPFFGGTYFPPQRRPGMASWPEILELVANAWQDPNQRGKIENSAAELLRMIQQHLKGSTETLHPETRFGDDALHALVKRFDPVMGGFSPAPKFPSPAIQEFLFFYHLNSGSAGQGKVLSEKALEMALHTLRCMASGGIFDHIGGGFHRYATDARWHIPHFEKMLYDNAQLTLNYLKAFQIRRDPFFRQIAEETLTYVDREMTHASGGFFSAQDADSLPARFEKSAGAPESAAKREGAYYVWRHSEIVDRLGEPHAEIFVHRYGIHPAGNAQEDPYGEFTGENILYCAHTLEETARHFQLPLDSVREILDAARRSLLAMRNKRPTPHLDDKIITAWNGLMISAWARAYSLLGKDLYRIRAETAAEFLWTHLYDETSGTLYRIWRDGERRIPGMAEDYAAFLLGLLDTYETDFQIHWLERAESLARRLIDTFCDPVNGGFFLNPPSGQEHPLFRIKETYDGVIPSAASLAAAALLRLYHFTGRDAFFQAAEAAIRSVASALRRNPDAAPFMLTATGYLDVRSLRIVLMGSRQAEETQRMLKLCRMVPHEAKTFLFIESPESRDAMARLLASGTPVPEGAARAVHFQSPGDLPPFPEKTTAYVCLNGACAAPITDAKALGTFFQNNRGV